MTATENYNKTNRIETLNDLRRMLAEGWMPANSDEMRAAYENLCDGHHMFYSMIGEARRAREAGLPVNVETHSACELSEADADGSVSAGLRPRRSSRW